MRVIDKLLTYVFPAINILLIDSPSIYGNATSIEPIDAPS